MKTNKLILKMMIVALLVITTSSCSDLFDDHDNSFDGPPQVEFTPLSGQAVLTPDSAATINITAQLIAEQRDNDLTFGVEVVDSLTNAVEGTHFNLPSSSVTIPANSSAANYSFQVMGDDFPASGLTVAIALQGTEDVEPAENLRTYTLTLLNP